MTKITLFFLLFIQFSFSQEQPLMPELQVPDWVKDAVFYQIFPERFANGDPSNDPQGVEKWGGKPKRNNYFGGDLQGIIQHLDYLQDLGINALYLNPIFESSTNHKYHAKDYYKIDPAFGTEETFKNLIQECHKRGMKVIIDGVFNHTGTDFFAFEDIKKNEKESKYLNWYSVHGFPVGPPDKPNYECWVGLGDLPKLMTDSPAVRNYIFDVTKYWMKFGLDGWRLDVPKEISHDFWKQWRTLVKKENPDAYIVGELWEDASPWLKGDEFDATMNYRFRNAVLDYFVNEETTVSEFDSALEQVRVDYDVEATSVMQNLLGSHDTERFLTLSNGNVDKLKIATLFQMTYPGAPMVYYGDEVGMEGGKDPDCRRTMEWDKSRQNGSLYEWFKKLIKLRNTNAVLRRGEFEPALIDNDLNLYGYWRTTDDSKALILLNNSKEEHSISIDTETPEEVWVDALNGTKYHTENNQLQNIVIPPFSGAILFPKESDSDHEQ